MLRAAFRGGCASPGNQLSPVVGADLLRQASTYTNQKIVTPQPRRLRGAHLTQAASTRGAGCPVAACEALAMVALPAKGKLKGVLYDIDGTLVNSDPLHYLAWRELLVEKGYNGGQPITEAWFTDKLSGGHNPEAIAMLFPGINDADNAAIADDKEARFRVLADVHGLEANAGLPQFLEWADAQGLKKAAVTNAPRLNMEAMLKALGLIDKFDAIIVGEECARAKPHPDPYLDGAKALGLGLDEVFAVEDSPSGIQAAVAGDIPVIALTVGHPRAKLEAAKATHVLDNWFELAELVKSTQA